MKDILAILFIAIALSMDAFSMSLAIGTNDIGNKKTIILSLTVGIMHFIMPLIGLALGFRIAQIFSLNGRFIFSIILIILAINMLIESKKEAENKFNLNLIEIFFFAFGVSIDSFSTGIALGTITSNIILAISMFSIFSFTFTFAGLTIGKYVSNRLGKQATKIGAALLIIIAIFHIF